MKSFSTFCKSTLVGATLCFSLSTHAALVQRDLSSAGDGLLTYDANSGLEWLSQSACLGYTLEEMGSCSNAASFRIAAFPEIDYFLLNAGISTDPIMHPAIDALRYLGVEELRGTGYLAPSSSFYSIWSVNYPNDSMPFYMISVDDSNGVAHIEWNAALAIHPEYELSPIALVRSAVPVPATMWLFGSALMGLAAARRKCNKL